MVAYASRTGTKRNLAALRAADWRLMVSARGVLRTEDFRYALDNGAWTAHQRSEPFDFGAFDRAVALLGADADLIVVPDVVGKARQTLDLAAEWLPRLDRVGRRRLIAVQDGMVGDDVSGWLSDDVGLFVGGSTEWKERTMHRWARLARQWGAYCHVGRVNTRRRIRLCALAGVDSFDGSSVTRYAVNLAPLDAERRQGVLF